MRRKPHLCIAHASWRGDIIHSYASHLSPQGPREKPQTPFSRSVGVVVLPGAGLGGRHQTFSALGQYSWHLFYRLLSLEWGGRGECFNLFYVLCLKKKNLFINEKYNTYKEVGSVFLVSFSVLLVCPWLMRKKLSWGPFCGLQSGCLHCSLASPTGSPFPPTCYLTQTLPESNKPVKSSLAPAQGFSALELMTF